MNSLCEDLQRIWHDDIPISAAMGIEVVAFDNHELSIRAKLAPNVNVHGTAFAGSLYSVAALCGWGATHLSLSLAERPASIVIATGNIDYRTPVKGDIEARCRFPYAETLSSLSAGDKARFDLEVAIGAIERPAARFTGTYAIRLPKTEH